VAAALAAFREESMRLIDYDEERLGTPDFTTIADWRTGSELAPMSGFA